MYHHSIAHMSKLLGQLDHWFDVAVAHAEAKKFDPTLYLSFRLAPDQFALARQVQIACDTVKLGSARLAGKDAPSHADDEKTIDDLRARVKSTRAFVDGLAAKDFEHAATRVISQPRWEGKVMTGQNYFHEHVTPNFYFHLSHTYAILRHNGVPLGKKDYLGALTQTAG
jgi:hypothetical protein